LKTLQPNDVLEWADTLLCAPLLPAPLGKNNGGGFDEEKNAFHGSEACNGILDELKDSVICAGPQMCGYVFKTGDMAWNCMTCGEDDTCVQCMDCYSNANHTGHDVRFHRAGPGGCCDCGDPEAWKAEGCCPRHAYAQDAAQEDISLDDEFLLQTETEALRQLPPQFLHLGQHVIDAAVAFIVRVIRNTMTLYNCEDDSLLPIDYAHLEEGKWDVMLRNDDVHTFQDVVAVLKSVAQMSHQEASTKTEWVDKKGHTLVKKGLSLSEATAMVRAVRSHKPSAHQSQARWPLLSNISCQMHARNEAVAVKLISWLCTLSERGGMPLRFMVEKAFISQSYKDDGPLPMPPHGIPVPVLPQTLDQVHTDELKRSRNFLDEIVLADGRIVKGIQVGLSDLFMRMIVDIQFKYRLSQAWGRQYVRISEQFMAGVGVAANSFLSISVQLLTVPSIVKKMQDTSMLMYHLAIGVKRAVMFNTNRKYESSGTPDAPIELSSMSMEHSRYSSFLHNFGYALQQEGIMEKFTECGHEEMLSLLCTLQDMNRQKRIAVAMDIHQTPFDRSFELECEMSRLYKRMVLPRGIQSSRYVDRFVQNVSSALERWTQDTALAKRLWTCASNANLNWDGEMVCCDNLTSIDDIPFTFHIPLIRYFSCIVRHCIMADAGSPLLYLPFARLQNATMASSGLPAKPSLVSSKQCAMGIVDVASRVIALEASISVGEWRYNGVEMEYQAHSYTTTKSSLCRVFQDADILTVQWGVAELGPAPVLSLLLHRFDLAQWFSGPKSKDADADSSDTKKKRKRLHSKVVKLLQLLLTLCTQLPFLEQQPLEDVPIFGDGENDDKVPLEKARSEVIVELAHALTQGPCTISKLSKRGKLTSLNRNLGYDEAEALLCPDGVGLSSNGPFSKPFARKVPEENGRRRDMDGGVKYELTEFGWSLYKPCYSHLNNDEHLNASRNLCSFLSKNKFDSSKNGRPMLSWVGTVSAGFASVVKILFTPMMHRIVHCALRDCLVEGNASVRYSLFSMCLMILTLQIEVQKQLSGDICDGTSNAQDRAKIMKWFSDLAFPEDCNLRFGTSSEEDFQKFAHVIFSTHGANVTSDMLAVGGQKSAVVDAVIAQRTRDHLGSSDVEEQESTLSLLVTIYKEGGKMGLLPEAAPGTYDPTREDVSSQHAKAGLLWIFRSLSKSSEPCARVIGERLPEVGGGESAEDAESAKELKRKEMLRARKERQRKAMEAMQKKQKAFAAKFTDVGEDNGGDDSKTAAEDQGEPDLHLPFAEFNETSPTCIICSLGNDSKETTGPLCLLSYAHRSRQNMSIQPAHVTSARLGHKRWGVEGWRCRLGHGESAQIQTCGHYVHSECWTTYHLSVLERAFTDNAMSMVSYTIDVENDERLCPLCKNICNTFIPIPPEQIRNGPSSNNNAAGFVDSCSEPMLTGNLSATMKWFLELGKQSVGGDLANLTDKKYTAIVEQFSEFVASLGVGNKSSQEAISECYRQCSKKNTVELPKEKPLQAATVERLYGIFGLISHTLRSRCINTATLNVSSSASSRQSSSVNDEKMVKTATGQLESVDEIGRNASTLLESLVISAKELLSNLEKKNWIENARNALMQQIHAKNASIHQDVAEVGLQICSSVPLLKRELPEVLTEAFFLFCNTGNHKLDLAAAIQCIRLIHTALLIQSMLSFGCSDAKITMNCDQKSSKQSSSDSGSFKALWDMTTSLVTAQAPCTQIAAGDHSMVQKDASDIDMELLENFCENVSLHFLRYAMCMLKIVFAPQIGHVLENSKRLAFSGAMLDRDVLTSKTYFADVNSMSAKYLKELLGIWENEASLTCEESQNVIQEWLLHCQNFDKSGGVRGNKKIKLSDDGEKGQKVEETKDLEMSTGEEAATDSLTKSSPEDMDHGTFQDFYVWENASSSAVSTVPASFDSAINHAWNFYGADSVSACTRRLWFGANGVNNELGSITSCAHTSFPFCRHDQHGYALSQTASDVQHPFELPYDYSKLLTIVDREASKNPKFWSSADGFSEPCICLSCGALLCGGRKVKEVGECTRHAEVCGSGVGAFLLVRQGCTLLIREHFAVYHTAIYVDDHGEADIGLKRGRPLFLKRSRLASIHSLIKTHGIASEVVRTCNTQDRFIKKGFF
jgi:ATP-dependent Clp protease adapter protein ClpS